MHSEVDSRIKLTEIKTVLSSKEVSSGTSTDEKLVFSQYSFGLGLAGSA